MTMNRLLGTMRAQANMANQAKTFSKLGLVTAYDPNTYSVKVTFQPDGNETGWLPLGACAVGAGWGIYAPPTIGDQIEVRFQEGDRDTGVAGPVVFDNQSPPAAVPSGEVWIVHKSGQFAKLTNDGKFTVSDGHGASVFLNGDGTISSTGAWTHTGDFNVHGNQAHTGSITSNGKHVDDTLKVSGVTTGGGTSGTPV
jgi:phage baseplate assembly protein gpV